MCSTFAKVNVAVPGGGTHEVEAPLDLTVQEFTDELVKALLPSIDLHSCQVTAWLENQENTRAFDPKASLEECGVTGDQAFELNYYLTIGATARSDSGEDLQAVKITIATQGGDVLQIETPLIFTGRRLTAEVVAALRLARTDFEGNPTIWRLDSADSGRTIDMDKSLLENGVVAGERLSMIRSVIAGGPEIPSNIRSGKVWESALRYQLIYSLSGLLVGLCCIMSGLVLFLAGVTGSTAWTAKVIGLESELSDAAPGALVFLVGMFTVWATRFSPKVKNNNGMETSGRLNRSA